MPKPRKQANGSWTVQVNHKGQRRNLTLGKRPKLEIDHFHSCLQFLIEHVKFGGTSFPARLQNWVGELSERHKVQLGELGLFDYQSTGMTVGDLLDKYAADYDNQTEIAASTKKKVRSTFRNRADKIRRVRLCDIEPRQRSVRQNADPIFSESAKQILTSFNSWQRNHFSVATWSRDNKLFRSVGLWAVANGYLDFSPFSLLPASSMVNEERNEYVSKEMVEDAMEACLEPDVRLIFAMGRLAGLRTCSEVRTMKWSHVDESAGTLTIIDSKTKKPRKMPLFAGVREELDRQRLVTGTTRFVASQNLRSTSSSANYQKMCDAIRRSGQEQWVRVRQNLRTSCENDLLDKFDERLVTHWIGHSVTVSRKHYQRLRAEDYLNAIEIEET